MSRSPHSGQLGRQGGFSYVEILVATVLIAITLVPAMEALEAGIQAGGVHAVEAESRYRLVAKMEEVLAESFPSLLLAATAAGSPTTATSYSDAAGIRQRRLVYLSLYDGDNADGDGDPFTGADADLMWLRIEIENSNHVIETLTGP